MIPIRLTVEGIYSYQVRQTIDFNYLTEAGLFGIFGATGSGKSSILEAISYVLYGRIERLNTQDKRTYNMMNLKSNRAYLEFDFVNFENKKFRATREFKRNSNNFEKITTPVVVFYEWLNENWSPLEYADAEKLVGLSYHNFKRTIIIPQGQFKEFLELGPTERTKMMKEVFNLQKFDLQDNAARLRSENKTELDKLTGLLSGFEEVNEMALKVLEEQVESFTRKHLDQKKSTELILKNYQEYLVQRKEAESLQENLLELEKQKKKKVEIEQLRVQLNQFELARNSFSELINRRKDLSEVIQKINSQIQQKQKDHKALEEDLENTLKKQNQIKDYYEHLEEYKQRVLDLENVLKIKNTDHNLKELNKRIAKGAKIIEETEADLKKWEREVKATDKVLATLKEQKMDANLLFQMTDWYNVHKGLTKQLADLQKREKDTKVVIENELQELKNKKLSPDMSFEDRIKQLRADIKIKQDQYNHLALEQKLSEYADALHDGEACPLCGSLDHPHIHSGRDVSHQIVVLKKEIELLEKELEKVAEEKTFIQKFLDTQKFYQNQLIEAQKAIAQLQEQINIHLKSFVWENFDPEIPDKFEKERLKNIELENKIREKEKEYKAAKEQFENLRKNSEKYKEVINDIRDKITENQASKKIYLDSLKNIKIDEFKNYENNQIEAEIELLIKKNEEVDKNYKAFEKKSQELYNQLSVLNAELKLQVDRVNDVTQKEADLTKQLQADILVQGFKSFEEVSQILSLNLNVVESRQKIEDFNIQYTHLNHKIKEQQTKLKDFRDSDELFIAKEKEALEAESALANISKQLTQSETEYKRLKGEFARKMNLLKQQTELQKRQENLNLLFNLLKGNGFVEYVSTIFLRQLCDNANSRFHRMTRNQLSLQLNDNNDFEVIDYLNEGRSRSVKTLSGGQAFQVSLSLALALAESVQSHNQSQQNFFFIDEGFGTQDTESVNIVFDTLLQLHKENRIVGIISHVDELKERIPRALQITKDEERGSRIEVI